MENALLNQGGIDYSTDIKEPEPFKGPELNEFSNPFSKFQSTSQPVLAPITTDNNELLGRLDFAEQQLFKDPFNQAQRFETPAIPGYDAAKQSKYFDKIGIVPGMDVEEVYGNAQSGWDKLSKGIFGGVALAGNQMVSQFTSWGDTIGVITGLATGKGLSSFETPYKQDEMEAINAWQNDFENKYHIFQTQQDRNTFFNISNLASTVQQSGYAIGAILEIAAEEFALSALTAATFGGAGELQALRTLQLTANIGKVINRTRKVEKSLQGVSFLRKAFNNSVVKLINPLGEVTDFAIQASKLARTDAMVYGTAKGIARTTARGFGAFYRDVRMLNAGITEAKSTVAPVMADMYNSAIEDYKNTHAGQDPSDEQKKIFKDEAFKTAQIEGAVQAAWIGLTDKIAFDGIFKTFKGTRFLDDGLIAKGIFRNTEAAIANGEEQFVAKKGFNAFLHQLKIAPVQTILKAPIIYTKTNLMEGLQETGQDVIDSATKQWYLFNYGSDEQRKVQKDMNDFLYAGAKQQLTMDGLKTFMSGFLTGGFLNVLGGGLKGGMALVNRAKNIDGYKDSVARADEERNKLTSSLNQSVNNKTDFYRSLVEMDSAMTSSAKDANKKDYWDHRSDFINKYALDIIKSGTDEVVVDKMKEAINELSVEEFKQAFTGTLYEGLSEEESKKIMGKLVNTFETKIKEVKDTYHNIRENYGNPYNPGKYKNNTEEYKDEVANFMAAEQAIDQIAFSKGNYTDIAKRQVSILSGIKSNVPNMDFNFLYSLTSPSLTLNKELEMLQKEYEVTEDPTIKAEKKVRLDILNKYKDNVAETITKLNEAKGKTKEEERITETKKVKADFIKNNSSYISTISSIDNKELSALTSDVLNETVGDIFDYLHLQTDFEDALSYFNLIANPTNFNNLHKAHLKEILDIIDKIKSEKSESEKKVDGKTVDIDVVDKEGKPYKVTLVEGDEFITESTPTKRVMRKSGKVITTHDQDIIKIESIDLDNKTVTFTINNDEENTTQPLDEFAKSVGRLWNLNKMDPNAALFFRNRDRVIVIKVNKNNGLLHKIDGVNAKKDFSSNSEEVYAIIKYESDPDNPTNKILYFDYKTKNGKYHRVPFDINYYNKYGVKTDQKYLLKVAPTVEDYLKEQSQKRKLAIYNRQVQIFELLIKEQEQKSGPREQRKKEIDKQIYQIKLDLDEAEEYVKLANQEINDVLSNKKKLNSKQKKQLASLNELITEYNDKLVSLKETNASLNAEKIEIEKELKVFEELSETYYAALDEIKKTENPFLRNGKSQTIYGEEEEKLQETEDQRPTSYVEVDNFERVLTSLKLEKNDIDNKLKVVEDTIEKVEKLISRFTKYNDIINAIVGTDPTSNRSKNELQAALVKLKFNESNSTTPDIEKIGLINSLLSGLNTRFKGYDKTFGKETLEAISFINLFDIATKEKQKLEDQLNFVSQEIQDISEGKEYIEKNIIPIKERIQYLKNIEKILLEGQSKLQSLNLIDATKRSVKAPTTDAAEEFVGYGDIMSYEEVTGLDAVDDDIIILDHDRVRFINALFKTAGRHYENSGDAQRNNTAVNPEQDRFFTFTSNNMIVNQSYFLLPVTEANDKYGIIQKSYEDDKGNTVEVKDDIKLIVVKKVGGKYIPVDKYGSVLPEDQQTKDNLVFNSMVNKPELLQDNVDDAIKWLRSDANTLFTITKNKIQPNGTIIKEEYTDEELKNELNSFKKFRNGILKDIKEGKNVDPLSVLKKSIGKQRREVLDVTTGKPQELPLQGKLIETDPDFSEFGNLKHPDGNLVSLRVSTKNSGISDTIKTGRMVIQKGDTFYQVYNRRLTEQERDNVFNVILTLLPLFGKRWLSKKRITALTDLYDNGIITLDRFTELTKPLSLEEKKQFDLGLQYLLHTIYWSQVREGDKIGNKQFYIKGGSLYVGNKGYSFENDGALNLQNIIDSKDEIMNIISKDKDGNPVKDEEGNNVMDHIFHAINSGSINKKGEEFTTVKVVDGKIVKDEKFKNYLEYLLSDKNKRSPIVYTNIVDYSKDEPQLANSYLIYSRPGKENPVSPKPEGKLDFSNIPINKEITLSRNTASNGVINISGIWNGSEFIINSIIKNETGEDLTTQFNTENKSPVIKKEIEEFINDVKELKSKLDIITDLYNDKKAKEEDYINQTDAYNKTVKHLNSLYFDMKLSEKSDIKTNELISTINDDVKTSIEGLNERLDSYGNASLVLSSDFFEGKRPEGKLNGFKALLSQLRENIIVLADVNWDQFNFFISKEDIEKLNALKPLAKELDTINSLKISTKDSRTVGVEKRFAQLTNQLVNEFVNIVGKYVEKELGKKINSSKVKIKESTTIKVQPLSEYKIVEFKTPNHEGHKFGLNNNGITVSFYTKEAAENWIKNKQKEISLPAQQVANKVSSLKEASKTAVGNGNSSSNNYRKYFEKSIKEKEDIEEFKKWLSNVLPQIGLETSTKLIDDMAFGMFVNGVIKLYENAEKGTGFHEAFEAVWNSYLTPEQKQTLINEYKLRENYQNLPGYIWANEYYPEHNENDKIKEALAEEFIDYIRDEGKTTIIKNSPVRNTLFRKLLNFIKKLWNHIQEAFGITDSKINPTTINDLFKKIVTGQYANKKAINITTTPQYRATVTGTSVKFTHDLMEGMTSYFFSILYNPNITDPNNTNVKSLFDKTKPQLFNDIYKNVVASIKNDFGLEYQRIEKNYIAETGASEDNAENFIASIPEFQYRNVVLENFNKDVKEKFKLYLSQFGLQFKEIKDKQNEDDVNQAISKEETSTDRLGIVDAIYIDPRNMTKNEVKLLIASIASYTYEKNSNDLNVERNDLGLPILKDFGKKINLLLNELTQLVPLKIYDKKTKSIIDYPIITQMFDKLDNKYKNDVDQYKSGYEWVNNLKFRLGYTKIDGSIRDINELSGDEISLLIAFETSFTTNKNSPYKLIVGAEGVIYSDNTLDSTNIKRVREKWENNIKNFAKRFSYLSEEDLTNAPMIYINKDGVVSINNKSKEFIDLKHSKETEIKRLEHFGIEFTSPEESLDAVNIGEAYRTIYEYIKDGTIKTFDDLFGRQAVNSSINYLTKVEANLTGDDTILSVRNAEGKQQYSITQTNAISNIVNSFNGSKTLADFIASNEHLGTVDLNTGEVILHPYVQNSYILKKGGRYFTEAGNKRGSAPLLEYRYILGMSGQKDSIGESTDTLTFPDKIAQEIYHLLDGTFYTVINSDKASEFGLHIGNFISFESTKDEFIENEKVIDFYKNALYDEVNTAFYEKSEEGVISKIKDYSSNVLHLGHFKNILKLDNNTKLNAKYQDVLNGKMSVDDFVDLPEITTLIVNYLNLKVEKTKQWLVDSGVVNKTNGYFKTNYFSKEQLQTIGYPTNELSDYDYTNLVKYLVVNRQLGVFEQHKIIYGHPELYKDLPKRSSGANSQTQVISENSFYLDWMDEHMKRYDGLSKRTNTFRYTSYKDPEMASIYHKEIAETIYKDMIAPFKGESINLKLKGDFEKIIGAKFNDDGTLISITAGKRTLMNAYISMTENDGGSYIMPDFFRDLHFLSGKENKDQFALLDYENASEILDRSNPEHPMYNVPGFAKSYGVDAIKKAEEIKEKGKLSGVMLQILKPYGFGYNKTTAKRTHTSLLKNSIVPLTWSRVVGKQNMLEKYLQSQKDNIDIIAFEGSQKVGFVLEDNGVKAQDLYDDNGHINTTPNPIQEMYTRYFGFQVEMANYAKDKTIFGTQMRKITLSNLPEELHEAASEYNKLIDALTETEFNALLKQVGLKKENDEYVVDNVTSMLDSLRSEVIKRDLPESVIDLLQSDINDEGKTVLKYKFDASPIREKLNNILNSIVDNRILAQEMNGKAAIQIPATMFETSDRKFTYLKDGIWQEAISGKEIQALPKEQKITAKIISSDLEFYKKTTKNGKEAISSMEVYAPWMLRGVDPETVGFELKNGIWMPKDPSVMESFLKSIGFRIPTQGMNSIDSILIKGFLPEDWGDSVVVPSEIVAKAGSDFDIDKLNMFFKNLIVKDGQIVEIKYDVDPKNIEKRYNKYINSEYGDILNPLRKILSNIKSKTKENDAVIQKLKDDIDFAEELLLKGDESAGKLIANLFKLEITNFNDLMNADIELQSLQYEGEYLSTILENAIDKYKENLESIKSKFTLEEFSKLPAEQQNSKKAVQNRLIDLMSEILTHPSNYRQLTSPNSTSTLKPLAEEIRGIKGLKDVETDKTALSEWDVMTSIREAYITGKKLVGITALQITSHSLSQYGDVSLTGLYKDESGEKQTVVIHLDHASEEGKFILNLVRDKNYQLISELLSESMNGAVDAAKDPFIFDLNLTLSTASTWFYLQKLGVPIKDLAYLHNQPAIAEYLKTSGKNNSIVNKVNDAKASNTVNKFITLTPYLFKAFPDVLKNINQNEMLDLLSLTKREIFDKKEGAFAKLKTYKKIIKNIIAKIESKEFTQEDLKNMIKPIDKLSVEQSKDQILVLRNYLEYQKQGQMLSDYIRGVAYDTTKTKNLSENKLQEIRYNKVVNDGFINLDSLNNLMSKTFLNKIKSIKDDVPKMFKDYFISLHPKSQAFMQKVYDIIEDTDTFMTDDDKVLLLNRYENFFLTYLTHVVKMKSEGKESSLNSNYSKMFIGQNSIASTLKKYQNLYPDNKALETLFGIINSNTNSTNNIKIFDTKMSTYEINTFGESLVELYDYADMVQDEDLKTFVKDLSVFSILQSGVQQSPISYTKILPLDFYSEIVGNIFDNFLSDDDINFTPDNVWKQFNQNNYYNSKLVETIHNQGSFDKENASIRDIKDKFGNTLKDDYIVIKFIKKELQGNKVVIEKLIKNKKWDDIYDTILFEKIKSYDSTGKELGKELPDEFIKYTPINILGNGMYLTEAYALETESILKNNIKIDESQYVQAIEDHKQLMFQSYMNKQIVKNNETIKNKPIGTINVYWGQAESEISTRILSNLAPRKFSYESLDGITREYGSVEHAYQSNKNGKFDKKTYDAYIDKNGYGIKISPRLTEVGKRGNLQIMKDLVVESFIQNPNSEAAKKLLQYENFTHNTNELIDKAFLEGLKLAQNQLLNNQSSVTFDDLTEFTTERKQEIVTNFAAKHKMSEEEALNYINEAIQKQGKEEIITTLNKTDEFGNKCY